jgi:hypothetical protein
MYLAAKAILRCGHHINELKPLIFSTDEGISTLVNDGQFFNPTISRSFLSDRSMTLPNDMVFRKAANRFDHYWNFNGLK